MKNWTSKEIKAFRERHKLTRPALGRLLGVSGNYIYLMEKGVRNPGKSLKLLLDYVERDLNENKKGKGKKEVKNHGKSKRHL